ncbi:T9SS type A sorting domain-containing protein [Aestuariivivens insulae]|uniref:T9SS type A sorting domain-containing protein n=1 Tax=Aestuariivivens insulae TaxID=1621988 RepID=UPI001F5907BA|nr:T9SS type A sorting domain-containing protein [Aestuariivivens insulae]
MKKITFLLLLTALPLVGFAQTFNFTSTDDGWNTLNGFTSANGATYMTLTTVDGDGVKNNPTIAIGNAGVDTSVNSVVGITLRNNDATGPDFLRVSYPKPSSGRFYVNLDITTGDSGFVTYWFDLTSAANWVGTMNDFKLHFKSAGNTDYILPNNPNNISIDIDKIEFAASVPTTLKEIYNFDIDNDTEGFTATNGAISGPIGGILTFTPTVDKYAKLEQTMHHVDADVHKQIHITLKNNSATNDQLRLVSSGPTQLLDMSTSDATEKTYTFDMSSVVEWTGNQLFTIGIGSTVAATPGQANDAGTVEINTIVVDNVLSTKKLDQSAFSLYPNPAKGILNIKGLTDVAKVELFSITGKRVMSTTKLIDNKMDISALRSGLYLVKITNSDNAFAVKKLVVE